MPAKNAWNARQSLVHKPGTELIKANQQGTIHKAALKTTKAPNCTPVIPVTQRSRDNSGTSPSDVLPQLIAKWQQRPETPALISRHHTSSSHDATHQCSDSAEEWIRPGSNHPLRRRTAPPATPVDDRSPLAQAAPKQTFFWEKTPSQTIDLNVASTIQLETSREHVPFQLKERDIDVAVATK